MTSGLAALFVLVLIALSAFTVVAIAQQKATTEVVAQTGAPAGGGKAALPEAQFLNVSGNWQWRIIPKDARVVQETTFDVQLTQNDEVVKGSFDCLNCPRIVNKAPISGTLKNGKLLLVREDLANSGFELTATPDGLTGIYTGRGNVPYTVVGTRK